MWDDVESELSSYLGIYWQMLDRSEQQQMIAYALKTIDKRTCLYDLKRYAKERLTRSVREALLIRMYNRYGSVWDDLPFRYKQARLRELTHCVLTGDRFKFKAELHWIGIYIERYKPKENNRTTGKKL